MTEAMGILRFAGAKPAECTACPRLIGVSQPMNEEFYGYSKLFVLKISYFICLYFCLPPDE